jgi:hypothetical protein
MQKTDLVTYIKKYYLNPETDRVIWKIKNGQLTVNCNATGVFATIDADVSDLPDVEFGVMDTSVLLTRLSAMDGDVQFNFNRDRDGNPVQLVMDDGKLKVTTTLTKISDVQKFQTGKKSTRAEINVMLPTLPFATVEITKEFTAQVNKIKKALPDSTVLQLSVENDQLVVVGSNSLNGGAHSTQEEVKFTYPITILPIPVEVAEPTPITEPNELLDDSLTVPDQNPKPITKPNAVSVFEPSLFNLNLVQSIFAANTDYKTAIVNFYFINQGGLIAGAADFIFTAEDCISTYLVKSLVNNN